ncbi:hypothetical protein [uncultured Lactobacillus sp.]|uniref:hypothetical protein n=1 Tax=uncultured Lactobacillus sp. TaxID=153152 RepID=UPI0026005065|nr:hypothetical protein [uncultured Lactobacillus sp.]
MTTTNMVLFLIYLTAMYFSFKKTEDPFVLKLRKYRGIILTILPAAFFAIFVMKEGYHDFLNVYLLLTVIGVYYLIRDLRKA